MNYIDNEIPKHKKKVKKKSPQKSKHKHIAKECLLLSGDSVIKAEYCTICGKILNKYYFESKSYNELEIFNVDDIFKVKLINVNKVFNLEEV